MKSFLIKEVSQKTGITVQTLHYYEKIGLCKPSYRRESGYRVYTQDDLITLQKITALKFFKFPLKTIKKILEQKESLIGQLKKQSLCLKKQAEELQNAHEIIEQAIAKNPESAGLSDDIIITLTRIYSMNTLQETKRIFSQDQIQLLTSYIKKISEEESTEYGKLWQALISEITKHLDESPASAIGERHAIAWMALVNKYFHDETLNMTIWNAYMKELFTDPTNDCYYKIPLSATNQELCLRLPKVPKRVLVWIDNAIDAMYKKTK